LKYVQINAYSGGWADSIIFKKHRELVAAGDESWVFWARGDREQDEHLQRIASYPEVCLDALQTRLDGKPGFHSKAITNRLLKKLDEIDPDVVHLHLLLGYYINVEMIFEWLSAHRCKVVWTLHDCWAFTGHCIHFTYVKCDQWRTGCACGAACPQKGTYPETFAGDGAVRWSYEQKKRLFTMLPPERVQLITPSQWLADLAKQSFLGKYDIKVVHNSINKNIVKPTPSDFRERFGLENRFVVLGVASKWSDRKGLADFVRLAKDLDSARFAVVVVGLSEKQITQVKGSAEQIVALPRTSTPQELAAAYTAADVFFNPTTEDNYPTVNLEAEACGTPVVTYDTGGCRETVKDGRSVVVGSYEDALNSFEMFGVSSDE
jgi:putative colanic acid biosynthesis glycosyltransferase